MDRSDAGKRGYKETNLTYHEERSLVARQNYEDAPKYCRQCEEKLPFEKRRNMFCGTSCSAIYTNQHRPSISKRSRICSCGNVKKLANKYCKECNDNRVYNKVFTLEEATSDKIRRRILLEDRGWRCEACGRKKWEGQPIPLELHHIDGDADNNTADNLQMICPNCHALTDTYKTKNIANNDSSRQKMRRKRYEDGKTF